MDWRKWRRRRHGLRLPIMILSCCVWHGAAANVLIGTSGSVAVAIQGISVTPASYFAGSPDGTVVGAVAVQVSPGAPGFTGDLSLSPGTTRFRLSSTKLPSNLLLNGVGTAGTSIIPITAAQSGISNSPFTQNVTISSDDRPLVGDEFVGPFDNWQNVKSSPCNATGNGITDDTTAIQTCLTAVGMGANNSVVWFPAGTYKITATLNVNNGAEAIAILCQDPATTKILWAGAAAGTMIHLNGVDYSRTFSRCAIDGGATNHAAIGIDQSYDGTTGHFDTNNDYEDIIFTHLTTGFQCGFLNNGCAEVTMQRDHFLGLAGNCVTMGNFNALDLWIRWSEFDHCGSDAITNSTGAGNWRSYYNIFRNSGQSDHHHENTGVFSIRGAYSIGAVLPYWGGGGINPAQVTVQNNKFLDWTNTTMGGDSEGVGDYNLGTTNIYGNIFRPQSGATALPCVFGEQPDYSLVMYSNVFACSPYEAGSAMTPHVVDIDSTVVSRGAIAPSEPILPPTEPNFGRTIFEIPPASSQSTLQTAINSASALAARAVVHIQNQIISVSGAGGLSIPANSDVQIICDGQHGVLQHGNGTGTTSPVLTINGPTKATVRECVIDGNRYGGDGGAEALKVTTLDQPGSQVLIQGSNFNDAITNIILFDQMDHTVVTLRDSSFTFGQGSGAAVKMVGGPNAAAGTPNEGKILWHSGTGGGSITPLDCSNGAYAVLRDIWYEGAAIANKLIHTSGRCTVTVEGWNFAGNPDQSQAIDIVSLNGKFLLGSMNMSGLVGISGTGTNSQVLGLGTVFYGPLTQTSGTAGTRGSGGGGGAEGKVGGAGGAGTEWDATHGSGGGGGGAGYGANLTGASGGLYGGGGAASSSFPSTRGKGGDGAQGIIAYSSPAAAARTYITSGTTWSVPAGWNSADNVIEVIGGGGGARSGTANGGGGGYSKVVNVTLTPSSAVGVRIGSGGPGGVAGAGSDGTAGGDTWLCSATTNCASLAGTAVVVGAQGGAPGVVAGGGLGGAAAAGVGATKFSGGPGGSSTGTNSSGGGGGAAGPNGNGAAGASPGAATIIGGSGGGGNGNGGAGVVAVGPNGGQGGTAYDATAGGPAGVSSGGTIFTDTSGGTSGLLAARQATSHEAPDGFLSPVGTTTSAFVRTMMAQALATTESPAQPTPPGVSDLRLYRIWARNGNQYSIHLCASSC